MSGERREEVSASRFERLLVWCHRFVSRRVDLRHGAAGRAYRRTYFAYKAVRDRELVRRARRLARPGCMVVDVGAGLGFFASALARCPDVTVLAFEPSPDNFEVLQDALRGSGREGRVAAHRVALSERTGPARLYLSGFSPLDHKLIDTRSVGAVDVTASTLDDFLAGDAEHGGTPISLIKIDVQGAELMVLRGMRRTLASHGFPPILVELSPADLRAAGSSPAELFEAFAGLGYRPHDIRRLRPLDPQRVAAETTTYTNLLMVSDHNAAPDASPTRCALPAASPTCSGGRTAAPAESPLDPHRMGPIPSGLL